MAITPMFQVDLRSKQAQRDNRRTKIPYFWRFPLHSPLAGSGTVRATPGRQSPSSKPLSLKQSCSVPAPCTPRTCRERRIPLEPPKGRRLAKSASDQPSTTGRSSRSLGHNATPPKTPPLKHTPQGCSMPALYAGAFCRPPSPHGAPWGRQVAKTRYR